nr:hypothetical protein [Tanacetum cinerariifolium]
MVVSKNGSQSTEHINDNSSNPLSDESTVKNDYFDDFYGPFIPIHILEEERTRREHADYINGMEMLFTINPHVLPPSDDDSNDEVDVGDLRVDNVIQNSEHEYSENEDSNLDNSLLPLPPLEPPDKEFDFEIEKEISVVRKLIVKFECIDARMKFDVENDVFKFIMFSLLSVESEDTIFDPGLFSRSLKISCVGYCPVFKTFSEDFDFDNPPVPLPPLEPPDKEFDFEIDFQKEISVVRSVIVKIEFIDARVKFDVFNVENDDLSYFMFIIFDKVFSILSVESGDTIFDP